MKTKTFSRIYILLTLIFLVIFLFSLSGIKAYGQDKAFSKNLDKYETSYREELKSILKEEGLKNSGITMIKTYEAGTGLSYQVNINFPTNLHIESSEKELILNKLKKLNAPVEGALVSFSFS